MNTSIDGAVVVESAHTVSRTILRVYAPVPFVVSSSRPRRQLAEVAFNTTLNFREGTTSVRMLPFIEREMKHAYAMSRSQGQNIECPGGSGGEGKQAMPGHTSGRC